MRISWIEEDTIAGGGIPVSVENLQSLHDQGIRAIITLTEHPLTVQKELPSEWVASIGIELLHLPVVDQQPPTSEQVTEAAQFVQRMRAEGKPVYVHCHAGVGRTGTMLHALLLMGGVTLDEAIEKIKLKRAMSQYIMLSDSQKHFLEYVSTQLMRYAAFNRGEIWFFAHDWIIQREDIGNIEKLFDAAADLDCILWASKIFLKEGYSCQQFTVQMPSPQTLEIFLKKIEHLTFKSWYPAKLEWFEIPPLEKPMRISQWSGHNQSTFLGGFLEGAIFNERLKEKREANQK